MLPNLSIKNKIILSIIFFKSSYITTLSGLILTLKTTSYYTVFIYCYIIKKRAYVIKFINLPNYQLIS